MLLKTWNMGKDQLSYITCKLTQLQQSQGLLNTIFTISLKFSTSQITDNFNSFFSKILLQFEEVLSAMEHYFSSGVDSSDVKDDLHHLIREVFQTYFDVKEKNTTTLVDDLNTTADELLQFHNFKFKNALNKTADGC